MPPSPFPFGIDFLDQPSFGGFGSQAPTVELQINLLSSNFEVFIVLILQCQFVIGEAQIGTQGDPYLCHAALHIDSDGMSYGICLRLTQVLILYEGRTEVFTSASDGIEHHKFAF